jgi:hypothetical protein
VTRTIVLGFMGVAASGKSFVAETLRGIAGVTPDQSCCDIEFSDSMIDVTNDALREGNLEPAAFRRALLKWSDNLLKKPLPKDTPLVHLHGDGVSCPDCGLAEWLKTKADANQPLTRENKADHRQPLIWLGIVIRRLLGPGVWAEHIGANILACNMYEPAPPLVTAAGVRFPEDANAVKDCGGLIVRVVGPPAPADADPTNAQRHTVQPNVTVYNQVRQPAPLRLAMMEFWADLSGGVALPSYGQPLAQGGE